MSRQVSIRVAGLVLALAVVTAGAWYFFRSGGPQERDRVVHPAGYSVVKPRGWIAKIAVRPDAAGVRDSITLEPERWIGLSPSIWVRRLATSPDVQTLQSEGYIRADFPGGHAMQHDTRRRRYLVRRAVFESGSEWFEVGCSLPDLEATRIGQWWTYVETFKYSPVSHLPPSTAGAASQPQS
jgi:hypothetical protein